MYKSVVRERLRVFVAEATNMSSQLVAGALQRSRANFELYPFSGNSSSVLHELQSWHPDVSVISAELQDGALTGFAVLHEVCCLEPKPTVVMLLNSNDREIVMDAFRAGARGVFSRDSSFKTLPKCIRRVHEGQIWASNDHLEFFLDVIKSKPIYIDRAGGMKLLTPREMDVARLVVRGMRNQEISTRLRLREHTVRNYLLRIFDKLGISSRVELVLYAMNVPHGKPSPANVLSFEVARQPEPSHPD